MKKDIEKYLVMIQEKEQSIGSITDNILESSGDRHLFSLLCNIGGYSIQQTKRVSAYFETDIDLLAFAVRNLFEVSLILHYYLSDKNEDNVMALLNEFKRDALEIEESKELLFNKLGIRIEDNNNQEKHDYQKTPNVSELAKLIGAEEEYSMFYKMYSKFTHPSAYFLFGSKSESSSQKLIFLFVINAYKYLSEIESVLQTLFDVIKESNIMPNRAPEKSNAGHSSREL